MIEINGIAHIDLTVSAWERCRPFYEALLPFLGLKRIFAGDDWVYYVGGRTGVAIHRAKPPHANERFVQGAVGLHHVCFRCRSREDVDAVHAFVRQQPVAIIRPPEPGPWAPGYYSLLIEDPAGIRLEFNYVPGKGVFAEGAQFTPAGYS